MTKAWESVVVGHVGIRIVTVFINKATSGILF